MGGNPLVVVEGLVKSQVEVEGYPPSPLSRGLGLRGGEHPVPNNDHSPDRPSQKIGYAQPTRWIDLIYVLSTFKAW